MKKIYFTLLLMALPAAMFAQLKVNSDGNASIGLNTPYPNTFFSIGNVESSSSVGNSTTVPLGTTLTIGN